MAYEPTLEHLTSMDFKLDGGSTTILFRDYVSQGILDTFSVNSLTAVLNGVDIRIQYNGGEKILVDKLDIANISIDGVLVTQVHITAISELNALFANAGGGNAPTITSSASISLTVGNSINFTPTGTNVVAWTYDTLPTGIVSVEGQHKTIIGGSGLAIGSYSIVLRATNYHGTVTQTITLTVSASYTNTKSFNPANVAGYFRDDVAGLENNNPFYRAGGTTSTAWTVFGWTKLDTTGNKPLVGFGDIFTAGKGALMLYTKIFNASFKDIRLFYGNNSGSVQGQTYFAMATGTWFSWAMIYDGTATTSAAPFDLWINGVNVGWSTTSGSWSGSIEYLGTSNSRLTVAELPFYTVTNTGGYWDDIAFWDSDQSANISTFHNGGTPIDLGTYNPFSYYRFGDDPLDISAYPTLHNQGTTGNNLTAYNGTVADYVSDTPP